MDIVNVYGTVLFTLKTAKSIIELVTAAVNVKANLYGANLYGANLSGADLGGADLSGVKEDYLMRLAMAKNEVQFLYKAILDGKINGELYEGDCACFVGTIAKACNKNYKELDILKPDSNSLTEKWFMIIKKGDNPENSQISAITKEWTEEFMVKNNIPIPTRKVIWE